MTHASRRLLFFAVALVGGAGLLITLLLLFAQPPHAVTSPPTATSTPPVVATVDDEPISLEAWERAVALDQAMSALVGQVPPGPEETLERLINERLVLKAAVAADIPEADRSQADVWLANFLSSWGLEETDLDQALTQVGLSRAELVGEFVPRLLQVERALGALPPAGDADVWIASLRARAKVEVLANLSVSVPPALPTLRFTPQATPPTSGSRVGERAPDFSLSATDGTTMSLADLHGRPVLLNFWATWCAPCRAELSMLQAVYQANQENLVVLAINVREPLTAVTAFAADLGLMLPLLLDQEGRTGDAYQVHGLPTSLFIDRQGLIVARHIGPLDQPALDSYMATLLGVPPFSSPAP